MVPVGSYYFLRCIQVSRLLQADPAEQEVGVPAEEQRLHWSLRRPRLLDAGTPDLQSPMWFLASGCWVDVYFSPHIIWLIFFGSVLTKGGQSLLFFKDRFRWFTAWFSMDLYLYIATFLNSKDQQIDKSSDW